MPKEEKLPEDSKNSPLNPGSSLSPSSRNPISTSTTITRNFSQSVPGTSSSPLVGTKSTKSSHHEVKFQMQKKSEGIFKNSDSQLMCFFLLKVSMSTTSPESVSHWRKCQNWGVWVLSFMLLSGSSHYRCSSPHGSIELTVSGDLDHQPCLS